VEVAEVVDGDTLELVDGRRVRVLGIDTPERGEPCYAEATDHLTSLVGSGPVFLVGDPTQRDVDRYGRLLRYVDTSQGDASEQQAREGLARYYDVGKPVERAPQIQAAETEAQAAQRGIWSATPCAPVPEPAPTPEPVPPPAEPVPVPEDSGTYYPNCAAVREAGAAPLYAGDPGYSGDLDSDGDGVACE
jgi:micrococcal nuclease